MRLRYPTCWPHVTRRLAAAVACVVSLLCVGEALADKSLLVKVKRPDGSESSINQKVLVTTAHATLVRNPGDKSGVDLDPFSIFFRLKTDSGQLIETVGKDSYWRVGNEEGNPAGWIKTTATFVTINEDTKEKKLMTGPAVKEWNTRFVLDPEKIAAPDRPLNLLDPDSRKIIVPFKGAIDSSQGRALAFVLEEANENEEYPCEFFIGRKRTGLAPLNIENVTLEIAFVLEMTDYMQVPWPDAGGRTTLDLLRSTVAEIARKVEQTEKAKGRVRFAIVQYQDTNGNDAQGNQRVPEFAKPGIALNFATRATEVDAGLARLRPQAIGGDFPEDGLSGIVTAISDLDWSRESSKHVILVGLGAMQQRLRDQQVSDYDETEMSKGFNKWTMVDDTYGWSGTGKTVDDVCNMAKGGTGTGLEAALKRFVLHAILLGKPLPEVDPEFKQISAEAVRWPTAEVETRRDTAANRNGFIDAYRTCLGYQAVSINRRRAERDYAQLARNDLKGGSSLGIYEAALPSAEGVRKAGEVVSKALEEAMVAFENSLRDLPAETDGKIAARVVEITEAFKKQLEDKESVRVLGAPINEKGNEVAKLKILVFKSELRRLLSSLDNLGELRKKTKRSERQDATLLLKELKAAVASAAAGQAFTFTEDTMLAALIGDLPLRTPVLATTAKQLSAMSSEDFERWIGQLDYAKKRCQTLLDDGDQWTQHKGGIGSEFGFVEQSRMP